MSNTTESKLIEIAARWDAICDILIGNEVSDFMMSFPEVNQVADLVSQQKDSADADKERPDCDYCGISIYSYCPRCGKKRTT